MYKYTPQLRLHSQLSNQLKKKRQLYASMEQYQAEIATKPNATLLGFKFMFHWGSGGLRVTSSLMLAKHTYEPRADQWTKPLLAAFSECTRSDVALANLVLRARLAHAPHGYLPETPRIDSAALGRQAAEARVIVEHAQPQSEAWQVGVEARQEEQP